MRYIKALVCFALALMLAAGCVTTAFAGEATPQEAAPTEPPEPIVLTLGDADLDGFVTVFDVTLLQRYLAGWLEIESADALSCSEIDNDGYVTILDVTAIQQFLARMENGYDTGLTLEEVLFKRAEEERLRREEEERNSLVSQIKANIAAFKTMKGVDISSMNGSVDMNKLKAAGYQFVMIRCGYGGDYTSQDDSRFEENVRKAEAAGLYWGTYLYSYALNTTQAKSEVAHTLRLLEGKKPTMPVAFDMEDGDGYKANHGNPSGEVLAQICGTYLSGIAEAGYYPILYTGTYYLNHIITDKSVTGKYDLWVAQWYTECQYKASNVGMWQYGGETNYLESPYITGLSGMFDKDFCYKDYPDIIKAYGYNNWPALIEMNSIAGVSAQNYDDAERVLLPAAYHGYMGMTAPKTE